MKSTRELRHLAADWERLGAEDPLWAVCVDPRKKGGRWNIDEFLASGRDEIGATLECAEALGLGTSSRGMALDFGCGAGRLSSALAEYFDCVVGVDISQAMIDEATKRGDNDGKCIYVHNERPDLHGFQDRSFDLVYSSLVLQHISQGLALGYVREFLRVVRADGLVALSVPVAPRWTVKAAVFTLAPASWTGWIQRKLLGYPAPMRMNAIPRRAIEAVVAEQGYRIMATLPGRDRSRDWRVSQFLIAMDASGRSESEKSVCAAGRATPRVQRMSLR